MRRRSTISNAPSEGSPRRGELLDLAYEFVLEHGLTGLSLRPLAAATGTSPRVLLYLFGSKDGLVRELLTRVRADQLTLLADGLQRQPGTSDLDTLVNRLWTLLSAPEQRPYVRLTYEAFLHSLGHDPGPWEGFAAEQLTDWLRLLRDCQPDTDPERAQALATHALALVRGLLLDLLACNDPARVTAALRPTAT